MALQQEGESMQATGVVRTVGHEQRQEALMQDQGQGTEDVEQEEEEGRRRGIGVQGREFTATQPLLVDALLAAQANVHATDGVRYASYTLT